MIKKKGVLTIGICIAVVAVAAASIGAASATSDTVALGESDMADNAAETTVLVKTDQPLIGDLSLTSKFVGKVEPEQELMVYPKASGEVLTTYFKVGDVVQAGDVLCELDSTTLRTTIAQTQATIASAEAKAKHSLQVAEKALNNTEYDVEEGYDSGLIAAEAAVKTAETALLSSQHTAAQLRTDIRDLREDRKQVEDGETYDDVISALQRQLIQAEIAQETAQLNLERAQDTLRSTKKLTEERMDSVNDSVELAKLNTNFADQYLGVKKLQDSLQDYVITAAISGVVEQVNVDPHDMVSPQSPVYIISNKENMLVTFNVSSSAAQVLQLGDTTTVEIGSNSYTGTVMEIGTKVNSVGLFPIKVRINGDDSALMTGLTVTVSADTQHTQDATLLPLKYVYFKDNISYIYALEDNVAKKTPIEIGIMNDEYVEVLSGIKPDTQVITTWSPDLVDGVRVEIAQGETDEH